MYEKDFEEFAKRTLVIDCPKITLTQNAAANPIVISGSGSISVSQDGQLAMKLYASQVSSETHVAMAKRMFQSIAGRFIPEDQYFSMEAEAIGGTLWTTDRLLTAANISATTSSMVINGNPYWITSSSQSYAIPNRSSLTLYFYSSKEFPSNSTTKEEVMIDGKPSRTSHARNVAKFQSSGLEFMMKQEGAWRVLRVGSLSETLPASLRGRLVEALTVVFGYELYPAITVTEEQGKRTVRLSRYRVDESRQGYRPPLRFDHHDPFGNEFCNLFDKYFSYIMKRKEDDWHPLSCHVISAIRASEGSLEAQALSLAVAVEGVLKSGFHSLGVPDADALGQIEKARAIIRESDLGASLKTRIDSSIGNYKNPSASDRLMTLVRDGIIRENLAKTWRTLRNAHAHAVQLESDKFEQLLRDCHAVQTLLHELVFLAIGYTGIYTDYSVLNWPPKQMDVTYTPNDDRVYQIS